MGRAYVVGTFDTKSRELRHVSDLLRAAGHDVTAVDVSTLGGGGTGADVDARTVADAHPDGAAAVFTGDRGRSVEAMARALARLLPACDDLDGVIGLGGSGGTAIITPAMQRLPVGVPKIMVSTVASGDVAAYVGATDITMMPSVTDVAGLNRISRRVLGNAAHALAGMLSAPAVPEQLDLPAVGLTMFGVTTPCVGAVADALRPDWDCLVFHATGTGGRAMEKLVDDRLLAAVCDVSTTEIADLVAGGIMAADQDRLGAIARTGVPWVGSVGALDMVNFGAPDTVPERFRHRTLYEHNAQVTLMRTTADECRAAARFLAERLLACPGPVRLVLPTGGVSALDAPGMPFADPDADDALFTTLRAELGAERVVETPHHINDPTFADVLVERFREITGGPA